MSATRISQLTIYPIKSTRGVDLDQTLVEEKGLAYDRRFVVARPDGRFVTARSHFQLLQVHSTLTETGLQLRAPGKVALDLVYARFESRYQSVQVWSDRLQGQYCGEQAERWFSDWLGEPVQLLYFGSQSQRQRKTVAGVPGGQVSFADGYPLLLISQASLDDLNQRLDKPVAMAQFRPNIVVKGCDAFAEDQWRRIRIGEVEFALAEPCSRCKLITIDPDSAAPDPNNQPLVTLMNYRRGSEGQVNFGQNLVALKRGSLSLGDQVTVLE